MTETEIKYDVFISYSHKDETWADKILRQRLDDAGFKVCIDYRDFEAGKMALLNMQDSAMQSKHVVLVLTRNWLKSEWSLFEALMGGTEDPAGLQKKLILYSVKMEFKKTSILSSPCGHGWISPAKIVKILHGNNYSMLSANPTLRFPQHRNHHTGSLAIATATWKHSQVAPLK